jgi:hypothetical protein
MVETNLGIGIMEDLAFGLASPTAYNNANARLGVGDGNGSVPTVAATDTVLTAPTNKLFKGMNATYPSRSGTVTVTLQSTFATTDANFPWNEWGIDNGTTLFNHKGVSLGTKVNTATWVFTATLTQS